jgi:hypothetical protein
MNGMSNMWKISFRRALPLSLLLATPVWLAAQQLAVPVTTPLAAELLQKAPMKTGAPVQARLLYPIYVENQLAIPAGSTLGGTVVALKPDRKLRVRARWQGDFTPYDTPVVRFDTLTLPDGSEHAITSKDATRGAPVVHLNAAAPHGKRAFLRAQFDLARQRARDEAQLVTSPGRMDRLKQFLYKQLPYHPQRIEKGTAWSVYLSAPLDLAPWHAVPDPPAGASDHGSSKNAAAALNEPLVQSKKNGAWLIDAYLTSTISSAKNKPGDIFRAYVAQPVFRPDHTLAVPQGSVLIGTVTRAKPARRFGRRGNLRFNFRELQLPNGHKSEVQGTLAAADAAQGAKLKIDSEGGVAPKAQDKVMLPVIFAGLAFHAFDSDGNMYGDSALASNGFGIVGRITGIVAASRPVAAGIGSYAAALAFYNRWVAVGRNVTFPQGTRIEVVTAPVSHRMAMPVAAAKPQRKVSIPKKRAPNKPAAGSMPVLKTRPPVSSL